MFYRRKIDAIFEERAKKHKDRVGQDDRHDEDYDLDQYKNQVDLESGDLLGMILGAYYAFLPIFIVLIIILFLVRPW